MALNLGTILYSLGVNVQGMVAGANTIHNFASANRTGSGAAKQFVDSLRAMESASVLAVGPLSGLGARIRSLSALTMFSSLQFAAATAAIVGTGYGLFRLSQDAIHANLALTAVRQRLTLLQGSAAAAGADMIYLNDLARQSGTDFTVTADSYSQFIAALQGTSLEGAKARDVFSKITIAGSQLMLSTDQMQGTFRALTQMMSKGTVQAEELRGQLGDRLYGAFRIAATAVGATTSQLNIMLKKGQVIASDFLPKFADAFVKAMGVDTTKQVDNLQASTQRLSNSYLMFSDTLDRTLGISAAWKLGIESIDSAIQKLTGNIQTAIPIIGLMGGAIIGLMGPRILTMVGSLTIAVARFAMGWGVLNAVMMANPILGVVGLLVRLSLAIGGAYVGMKLLQGAMADTDWEGPAQDVLDYLKSENLIRRSLVSTTDTFIEQTQRQIEAQSLRMTALQAQLETAKGWVNEKFMSDSPKLGSAIESIMDWLFPAGSTASDIEGQINKVGDGIQMLKTVLGQLIALRMQQSGAPGVGEDAIAPTEAQLDRLEKANNSLDDLRMKVQALREGPGAVKYTEDFINAEDAVDSFRNTLEKAGVSQDVLNQKVGEFRQLMYQKLPLEQHVKAIEELQQVFVSFSNTAASSLADAFVEGTLSIQTFVDLGKRLLSQLIEKLIEMVILNQLLNAAFGTQLPTIGAGGFSGMFAAHAKGDILSGPTYLGFSGGKHHIGGEAGKEAVMPLVRTAGGDLGVRSIGGAWGAPEVNLQVNVHNEDGTKSEVKRNDSGGFDIRTWSDEQNASLMMQKGSKSNKALTAMGAGLPLKRL